MLTIVDKLNEISENFKGWMVANESNPLLWIGLFFGGILVFWFTYNSLSKNK